MKILIGLIMIFILLMASPVLAEEHGHKEV